VDTAKAFTLYLQAAKQGHAMVRQCDGGASGEGGVCGGGTCGEVSGKVSGGEW
jgi:hypothetical protein